MIVSDVADIIRSAVKTLPITKMECDFPEIHKDDVTIVNEMWLCPGLRKLHLETGRTKNLEVLQCVLYPDPAYPIPIFGCDIVANDKVVTAAIVDVSPVMMSIHDAPTFVGFPSDSPVTLIIPVIP